VSAKQECPRCGGSKPSSEFTQGRWDICYDCKASAQRRHNAGLRLNKCPTCGSTVEGYDICSRCHAAIKQLGGTVDGLKRAVRAWRWLQE
jgi:hypothetical protein